MRRVAGLDLSLAGSAAVVLDDDGCPSAVLCFTSVQRDEAHRPAWLELRRSVSVARRDIAGDYARTADVAEAVRTFLRRHLPTGSVVGIEDHAYGAKGTAVYQLGHLHGMVRRDVVASLACRFLLLGVGEVKQIAAGRGNAGKAEMVAAAAEHLDLGKLSRHTKEAIADAFAIARITWQIERARAGRIDASCVSRFILERPLIG